MTCWIGDYDTTKLLVDHGANVHDVEPDTRNSALHTAVQRGASGTRCCCDEIKREAHSS
jgi:ankyrin repeat protein